MKIALGVVVGFLVALGSVAYAASVTRVPVYIPTYDCEIRANADHSGGGWNQRDVIAFPVVTATGDILINKAAAAYLLDSNFEHKSIRCVMNN